MSQPKSKPVYGGKCPNITCKKTLDSSFDGGRNFVPCKKPHSTKEEIVKCNFCHCGHPLLAPQPQGPQSPEVVETPRIPQFNDRPSVILGVNAIQMMADNIQYLKDIGELKEKLAQSEAKLAAMSIELEAAKTHIVKLEEEKEKAYAKSQARRDALKSEKQHVVAAKGEKSGKPYVSHKNQHSNSNASPDSNQKTKPRFNKHAKSVGNKPETVNKPLNTPISMPESQMRWGDIPITDENVPVVSEVHAADASLSEASSS